MKALLVVLIAALLLATTASAAVAELPENSAATQAAAASAPAVHHTDWIRTIGVLGMAGVWLLRGVNAVGRRRKERDEIWAGEPGADKSSAPASEDIDDESSGETPS